MSSATCKLSIAPDGTVRFIYDDDLRDLLSLGEANISRASHVEPKGLKWEASMVGGPVLGPFDTRQEALAAERSWLNDNLRRSS